MKRSDLNLRALFVLMSLIAFIVFTISGYLYYYNMVDFSKSRSHKQIENFLINLEESIDSQLKWYLLSVESLSNIKELKSSLITKNKRSLIDTTYVLINFQKSLKLKNAFLLNDEGICIADSNTDPETSFTGKNYSFRPYFIEAKNGKPSIYMALGTTSKERGIYYSYPVYSEKNSRVMGVAVIKASLDFIEKKLYNIDQGIVLLTDPNYVIFVSNRNWLLYSSLWKMPGEKMKEVSKSGQFGTEKIVWTGIMKTDDNNAYDNSGNEYIIHSRELASYKGWKLIYLHDKSILNEYVTAPIKNSIGMGLFFACCFFGFIILFLFYKANRNIIQRKEAENALILEKTKLEDALSRVKELSGLLPICSSCKKIRDDKGYWNRIETYIENRSSAEFSHGICPECSDKLYGHEEWYKKMKQKEKSKS